MKEEALKLADLMIDVTDCESSDFYRAGQMIRRLVEELDRQEQECWCQGHSYAYLKAKGRLPQTKPLSDDEIIEMVKKHFIGAIKLGIVLTHDNVLEFARAIEERHGIK